MKKLPIARRISLFQEKIAGLYPEFADDVWHELQEPKPHTFRVHTFNAQTNNVLAELSRQGYGFEVGPLPNSYVVVSDPRHDFSRNQLVGDGKIYLQRLESMVPVVLLDPKPKEKVLDLCAAPGSKTVQIVDWSQGQAMVVAVDKHPTRFEKLKSVLDQYSVLDKVTLLQEDGFRLELAYPHFKNRFDKILVDAPCSSETYLNPADKNTFRYWNPKKYKDFSGIQKGLLISAYRMLSPGGRIVYSTCTFGVEENEMVIQWLIEKFPDLHVEPLSFSLPNFQPGLTVWKGRQLSEEIQYTQRILPNKLFGAFYVACLQKTAPQK